MRLTAGLREPAGHCSGSFTPSPEAIFQARRIVAAFAENADRGVIDIDGTIFDAAQGVPKHPLWGAHSCNAGKPRMNPAISEAFVSRAK